jgi:GTPase involved in cell partitioning and DNA repair
MLDLYRLDDVFQDYLDIRKELELFSDKLKDKEELIVFSKADLLDDEMREHILEEFSKNHPDKKYFIISAATGKGLDELQDYLVENFLPEPKIIKTELEIQEEVTVFDLTTKGEDPKRVSTEYLGDMKFKASGKRLEQIVRMTDFENGEAVMRVYNVLDKM